MENEKKNIDESWKDAVKEEKESLKKDEGFIPPQPDFNFFITTLAIQASISLGQIPNPATNKTEEDLIQAKFLIDTLDMIKTKTAGNLNDEESKLLDNLLYELKTVYVSKGQEGIK